MQKEKTRGKEARGSSERKTRDEVTGISKPEFKVNKGENPTWWGEKKTFHKSFEKVSISRSSREQYERLLCAYRQFYLTILESSY